MKTLGNVVFIQRGETWSLDFDVTNAKGEPYMLFREWKNPYLAITVTAARYEQKGDFRRTWWLDMDNRWEEKEDGTFELVPMKRFSETSPMYVPFHSVEQVLVSYPRLTTDDGYFDIKNYLFYTDPDADGNREFKYIKAYDIVREHFTVTEKWDNEYLNDQSNTLEYVYDEWDNDEHYAGSRVRAQQKLWIAIENTEETDMPGMSEKWYDMTSLPDGFIHNKYDPLEEYEIGDTFIDDGVCYIMLDGIPTELLGDFSTEPIVMSEQWEEYNFRIIKQFSTSQWTEQNYLFDMKVLSGETPHEHLHGLLLEQNGEAPPLPWTDEQALAYTSLIINNKTRIEMRQHLEDGVPLMPDYDTKTLILEPTKLVVSANIQGGFR